MIVQYSGYYSMASYRFRKAIPTVFLKRSSRRVSNGSQPTHVCILHFRNVVNARSLCEMCAARHDMV